MSIRHPYTTLVTSGATVVNEVIYPYPCNVMSIHVAHGGGAAAWIQIHDASSAPADGAIPLVSHAVSANSDATIEGVIQRYTFENGVYICESDTVPTKTLTAVPHLFITMVLEERTTP